MCDWRGFLSGWFVRQDEHCADECSEDVKVVQSLSLCLCWRHMVFTPTPEICHVNTILYKHEWHCDQQMYRQTFFLLLLLVYLAISSVGAIKNSPHRWSNMNMLCLVWKKNMASFLAVICCSVAEYWFEKDRHKLSP